MKRLVCLVFVMLLLLSACTQGSGSSTSTPSSTASTSSGTDSSTETSDDNVAGVAKEGLPIVEEKIELNALVSKNVNVPDWEGHPMTVQMEEWTNIKVNWESVPDAGFDEKRNLMFASNDLPDFLMRARMSAQMEAKYAQAGQLVKLDEYMDYAPYLSAIMAEDDGVMRGIAHPDGHFYALPQLNTTEGNLIQKYWINQTWLDKLGLPMPTTMDEFYDTLVAFRDGDPNGNGQKDEIPYAGSFKPVGDRQNSQWMFLKFLGAYGIGHYHPITDDEIYPYLDIDKDGKVYMYADKDNFKELVTFMNKLWSEGLIDKESYSQDRNAVAPKMTQDLVGFAADGNNTQWMGDSRVNFAAMPALTGPNGDRKYIHVNSNVQTTGTACITSVNEHPEATMRWLDYCYSEPGTVLIRMGIEGESWYKDDDGKYQLYDHIKNDPTGLTLDQAIGKWGVFPGGNIPQFITDEVDQSAAQLPETKAADAVLRPDRVEFSDIPQFMFTEEESTRLSRYTQDLIPYLNENIVKFITGERPMSEWQAYVDELHCMNLDDYISIYQASFDRWAG